MSVVDTPYIIGVIREREKRFLAADHYQRLIDAASLTKATQELADTIYAPYLDEERTAIDAALTAHLAVIKEFLTDVVAEPRVIQFITARYDGLNIATALLDQKMNRPEPSHISPLGSWPAHLLQSVIWHNLGQESLPDHWRKFIREQQNQPVTGAWKTELLNAAADQTIAWLKHLSFTPLMRSLSSLIEHRSQIDRDLRLSDTPIEEIYARCQRLNYLSIEIDHLKEVRDEISGIAYERAWDHEIIKQIDTVRHEPEGYDPIIAYWHAAEFEVKNIQLLLTAKANQVADSELVPMVRHLSHIAL